MVMAGSSRRPGVFLAVTTCTLACVVALLAGCGSTSSKTTTSTAAGSLTSSSSSPTSAAPSASPASESQLAKIVLQPSDLPPDWTPTPYKAEPGDTAAQGRASEMPRGAQHRQ
jgi:guanyl-specific ribonuclease Sa